MTLVNLYPPSQQADLGHLRTLQPTESYLVYRLSGFDEAGLHAAIRLAPVLALGLSGTALPLDRVETVANLAAAIARAVTAFSDGFQLTDSLEVVALLNALGIQIPAAKPVKPALKKAGQP